MSTTKKKTVKKVKPEVESKPEVMVTVLDSTKKSTAVLKNGNVKFSIYTAPETVAWLKELGIKDERPASQVAHLILTEIRVNGTYKSKSK